LYHETSGIKDRIDYGGLICGDPQAVIDQILALRGRSGAGILGVEMQWGNLPVASVRQSLDSRCAGQDGVAFFSKKRPLVRPCLLTRLSLSAC